MNIVSLINEAIINNARKATRHYIGASLVGRPCNREIWYQYHGYISHKPTSQMQKTFDVGKKLEELILDYIELAEIELIRPDEENHYLSIFDESVEVFQGHMDGMIRVNGEWIVLEIKTAKNSSFEVFKNKGLKVWSEQYYSQVQSYMGMGKYNKAVLICINKDNSELHCEWVDFNLEYYQELKMKALAISALDEPPERINKSPLFYVCRSCQFKTICHKD